MVQLLGANGLPLVTSGVDTIGPGRGRGFRVIITEGTAVTFPGARMLRMEPGEYAILTVEDLDAMTGGIAPASRVVQ